MCLCKCVFVYGSVWASGKNNVGQLGDGTTTDRVEFIRVLPTGAKAVAAAGDQSVIVKDDDSIMVIISGTSGGYRDVRAEGEEIVGVAVGYHHVMVVTEGGTVRATGHNDRGQFGDGSSNRYSEALVYVTDGAKAVAAGAFHSIMLKQDGRCVCKKVCKYVCACVSVCVCLCKIVCACVRSWCVLV